MKKRIHFSACAFCGGAMEMTSVAVITIAVKNQNNKTKKIMPVIERQICGHRKCVKGILQPGFLELMPAEIRNE